MRHFNPSSFLSPSKLGLGGLRGVLFFLLLASFCSAASRDQLILQDETLVPGTTYTITAAELTEATHGSHYFELCVVADSVLGYDDPCSLYVEVQYQMGDDYNGWNKDSDGNSTDTLLADTTHLIAYDSTDGIDPTILINDRIPLAPDSGYSIGAAIELHRKRLFVISVTDTVRLTMTLITQN